ncbi:MAG: hypothetical protein ACR2PL_05285 [Dehalococcoidia bacterium]
MVNELEFPELHLLHERHYGVTPEVGAGLAQAARVCLDRHHSPPVLITVSLDRGAEHAYLTDWKSEAHRAQQAYGNSDEATRDGAYCLALAAAEVHLSLVAYGRTGRGTGADYIIGAPGDPDPLDIELNLEDAYRLEVSGIDRCESLATLSYRVRQKLEQTRRGTSILPALAGVVAFYLLRVVFERAW